MASSSKVGSHRGDGFIADGMNTAEFDTTVPQTASATKGSSTSVRASSVGAAAKNATPPHC